MLEAKFDILALVILKGLVFLWQKHWCGCYLIGYSGLGGREIFQSASKIHAGKEIAYGDWFGFVQACHEFNERIVRNPKKLLSNLSQHSRFIRKTYSVQMMVDSVQTALKRWEVHLE